MIKDLVKKIYSFFTGNIGNTKERTLHEFCKTLPDYTIKSAEEGSDAIDYSILLYVDKICKAMVNKGLLLHVKDSSPIIMNNKYLSIYHAQLKNEIDYGTYDFMLQGFPYTYEYFKHSVVMITGHTDNGDETNGTAFYIGNHMMVTAKHCVTDLQDFKIIDINDVEYSITKVIYPIDESLDLAIILLQKEAGNLNAFRLDDPYVLDDVITIGFPPIPGFTSFQVTEKAQVSAMQIASRGANVGTGKDYLSNKDCFLISARVKGGNSGSPVINKKGKVVGVLVHLATDNIDQTKADIMGYGICLPSNNINQLLQKGSYIVHDAKASANGYFSICE